MCELVNKVFGGWKVYWAWTLMRIANQKLINNTWINIISFI